MKKLYLDFSHGTIYIIIRYFSNSSKDFSAFSPLIYFLPLLCCERSNSEEYRNNAKKSRWSWPSRLSGPLGRMLLRYVPATDDMFNNSAIHRAIGPKWTIIGDDSRAIYMFSLLVLLENDLRNLHFCWKSCNTQDNYDSHDVVRVMFNFNT